MDVERATRVTEAALATGLPVWAGISTSRGPGGTMIGWDVASEEKGRLPEGYEPPARASRSIRSSMRSRRSVPRSPASCTARCESTTPGLEVLFERWSGPVMAYPEATHPDSVSPLRASPGRAGRLRLPLPGLGRERRADHRRLLRDHHPPHPGHGGPAARPTGAASSRRCHPPELIQRIRSSRVTSSEDPSTDLSRTRDERETVRAARSARRAQRTADRAGRIQGTVRRRIRVARCASCDAGHRTDGACRHQRRGPRCPRGHDAADDGRRRRRLRGCQERRPHRPHLRAPWRAGHLHGRPGVAQALRPPRREGDRPRRAHGNENTRGGRRHGIRCSSSRAPMRDRFTAWTKRCGAANATWRRGRTPSTSSHRLRNGSSNTSAARSMRSTWRACSKAARLRS